MHSRLNAGIKRLSFFYFLTASLLTLIITLQVFFGKYGNNSFSAWGWLILHLCPAGAMFVWLFLVKRRKTIVSAESNPVFYRILHVGYAAYITVLLLMLLIQPFADANLTEAANLHHTDTGLLFFQFIVMVTSLGFIYSTRTAGGGQRSGSETDPDSPLRIFISYSHSDKDVARSIQSALVREEIEVVMDEADAAAGSDIRSFIGSSVKNSTITLSVISANSLLSGWVGMETINTFFLEKLGNRKRFIAVYLDDSFLDIQFGANAVKSIDARLDKLKRQVNEHDQLGIDARDLNSEKTRLLALRSNMDEILDRLRNSLCIDIRGDKLQSALPAILKSIRQP